MYAAYYVNSSLYAFLRRFREFPGCILDLISDLDVFQVEFEVIKVMLRH